MTGSDAGTKDEQVSPAATLVALLLQSLFTFFTFFMGMAWGGPTYNAALVQSILCFALIYVVATRWPRWRWLLLLVPPLSLTLTFALERWGSSLGHTGV